MIRWFFLIPFFELFVPERYFYFQKKNPGPTRKNIVNTKRISQIRARKMKKI